MSGQITISLLVGLDTSIRSFARVSRRFYVCAIFVRGVKLGGQNVHDTKNLRRVQVNMDQSAQNRDGERRFKCLYCDKLYKHRSHLNYHIKQVHVEREKQVWDITANLQNFAG